MKRILLVLVAIIGLSSAHSATKIGGLYYSFGYYSNEATVVQPDNGQNNYSGDVVIPSTVDYNGKTYPVTSIGTNAFSNGLNLKSVIIPTTVTYIGDYAFSGTSMTSITIPSSIKTIGNKALNSSNLTTINFNAENCTSCGSSSNPAFSRYVSEINIGSNVKNIPSYAFYGITNLTEITIPNSVTSIGTDAFNGCSGLKSVTIPNSVISIGNYAFRNCTGLTTVNFNAENCTSCGSSSYPAFPSNVSEINIGNNVKNIPANAFYGITSLTKLTIQASENVLNIGSYSFSGATPKILYLGRDISQALGITTLTEVELGYDVTNFPDNAFSGCSILTKVIMPVPGWMDIQLEKIGNNAFLNCSSLPSISLPSSVSSIGTASFKGCSSLQSIELSPKMTMIPSEAFSGCTVLSDINLPSGITSIGSNAFYNCVGLSTINFPSGLSEINSYAFQNCTSLDNITLSTSLKSIGSYSFDGCSALSSLSLPGNTETIGFYSFRNCSSLISANLTSKITTVSDYAFQNCKALNAVVFPPQVKSIGNYSFQGCTTLSAVILPEELTTVGDYAFSDCTALTEVTTSSVLQKIGGNSFYNCDLSELRLPASTTNIGANAFNGNNNLMTIYSYNSTAPICTNSNSFSSATKSNAKLYIPATGLSNYRGAVSWSEFPMANYMQLVELANIQIEAPANRLRINKQMNLEATLSPDNATFTDVVWSSSNPNVASITETGEVTALSTGFTVISAKSKGINALEGTLELEVIDFLIGDSNDSDFVTVTDAVNIASYVMDEEPEVFNYEASDVNEDGNITLADASGVITIVLNDVATASNGMAKIRGINDEAVDKLIASDFAIYNNEATVPVSLEADSEYVALQADIRALGGLKLDEITAGEAIASSHMLMTKRIDDSTVRVVVYSPALNIINAKDDALFDIKLSGLATEESAIVISNILATTGDLKEHELGFSGGNLTNGTTGIVDVNSSEATVEAGQGFLRILNATGNTVRIFTLDGTLVGNVINASAEETLYLNGGIYIVSIEGRTHKVVVR